MKNINFLGNPAGLILASQFQGPVHFERHGPDKGRSESRQPQIQGSRARDWWQLRHRRPLFVDLLVYDSYILVSKKLILLARTFQDRQPRMIDTLQGDITQTRVDQKPHSRRTMNPGDDT